MKCDKILMEWNLSKKQETRLSLQVTKLKGTNYKREALVSCALSVIPCIFILLLQTLRLLHSPRPYWPAPHR